MLQSREDNDNLIALFVKLDEGDYGFSEAKTVPF